MIVKKLKEENKILRELETKDYIDIREDRHRTPAAEVEKNGLLLGEMKKLLLKKVEELTLYLIEQQKVNQSLQEQISNLAKQIRH